MFIYKKIIFKIKAHIKINKIIKQIIPIYFFSILDKNLNYENLQKDEKLTICEQSQRFLLTINNVNYSFSFSDKNICFFQLELGNTRYKKTLLSKYSFLLKYELITDKEMLFYADSLIDDLKNFINDLHQELLCEPQYQKYLKMSLTDFNDLKKEKILKKYIPQHIILEYQKKNLSKELKKNKQITRQNYKI